MLSAQTSFVDLEQELEVIADTLMLCNDKAGREMAFAKLQDAIVETLKKESSFLYPFHQLRRISMVEAEDTSFRLFSGQYFIDEDHYSYYGILQMRDDPTNPIVLNDQSEAYIDLENDIRSVDDWYGAVYYNVKSFTKNGKTFYALFGFDAYQMLENRKVAEILHFNEGTPIFGEPVFTDKHGIEKNRLIVQYASDVTVKLNYDDDLQLIVLDNLIPMKSPYNKKKVVMVPDGSYRGYQIDQVGNWMYISKIFHTTLAEPPREKPVLDAEKGVDLFGRKSKN